MKHNDTLVGDTFWSCQIHNQPCTSSSWRRMILQNPYYRIIRPISSDPGTWLFFYEPIRIFHVEALIIKGIFRQITGQSQLVVWSMVKVNLKVIWIKILTTKKSLQKIKWKVVGDVVGSQKTKYYCLCLSTQINGSSIITHILYE